jgi:hypothetical protein
VRYLKGTISFGLHFTSNSSFAFYGFTNANWIGNVDNRKFMSSYLIYSTVCVCFNVFLMKTREI